MKKILALALISYCTIACSQTKPSNASITEDLQYFKTEFPNAHFNAYHTTSKEDFEKSVDVLIEQSTTHNIYQTYAGLMKIIAAVGDGHTWMDWWQNPQPYYHIPVKFDEFADGIFLTHSYEDYKDVVGHKLIEIEGKPVDDFLDELVQYVPGDNAFDSRRRAIQKCLSVVPILHGSGLVEKIDEVEMKFENTNGKVKKVSFKSIPNGRNPFLFNPDPSGGKIIKARKGDNDPLYLQRLNETFWLKTLNEEKTIYLRLKNILNNQVTGNSINDLAAELEEEINKGESEKLIVDLRLNGGGNNQLTKTLFHTILKSNLNQPEKLFVLVDDGTFSAAGHFVTYLEQHTNAIIVGEPTSFSPNHYGDPNRLTLPNTGWTISASGLFWQNSLPWDYRAFTEPDYFIEPQSQDFFSNNDPVMSFVLNFEADDTEKQIVEAIENKNTERASELYEKYKANPLFEYRDLEPLINQLGYRYLTSGDTETALIAFKLNMEHNPTSANAHDSLAEGYLNAGQKELSVKHYQKVLELNPSQRLKANAVNQLKTLKSN